jgi:hypothetical protein
VDLQFAFFELKCREREREREREIGELRKRRNWVFAISILVTLSVASE